MANVTSLGWKESVNNDRETLSIHWSAVFAGVFITLLVYYILMSVGVAIGATGLQKALQEQGLLSSSMSIGPGAGAWTILSTLIALFVGSYAAGRVSGIVLTRIGYSQGAVIASLVFIVMLSQFGLGLGLITSGLGGLTASVAGQVTELSKVPQVQEIVEDSLNGLDLRSPPQTVIAGVINRLLRDDEDSAVNYLAYQAKLSVPDARARLKLLDDRFRNAVNAIGQKALATAQWAGWSAFWVFVFGTLSALLGGGIGAQVNMRSPIGDLDRRAIDSEKLGGVHV